MAILTHTALQWAALARELSLMGLSLSGQSCPISLIIEGRLMCESGREIEGIIIENNHFDDSKQIDIELGDKQTEIVRRVYDQRVRPLELWADCK